jgi:exosome complex component RRP42
MTTSMELNPMASPDFEAGPPRPESIEYARVVDRGIRESGVIRFDELCVTPGEKVWMVFIDIHVLDYDGNLFDAASLAALGAILTCKVPNVQYGLGEKDGKLPVNEPPISCTTAKIGGQLLSDPGLEENQVMEARLTVALDGDGNIRAMQKGGNGSFKVDEVKAIIKASQVNGDRLRKLLNEAVKKGEATLGKE